MNPTLATAAVATIAGTVTALHARRMPSVTTPPRREDVAVLPNPMDRRGASEATTYFAHYEKLALAAQAFAAYQETELGQAAVLLARLQTALKQCKSHDDPAFIALLGEAEAFLAEYTTEMTTCSQHLAETAAYMIWAPQQLKQYAVRRITLCYPLKQEYAVVAAQRLWLQQRLNQLNKMYGDVAALYGLITSARSRLTMLELKHVNDAKIASEKKHQQTLSAKVAQHYQALTEQKAKWEALVEAKVSAARAELESKLADDLKNAQEKLAQAEERAQAVAEQQKAANERAKTLRQEEKKLADLQTTVMSLRNQLKTARGDNKTLGQQLEAKVAEYGRLDKAHAEHKQEAATIQQQQVQYLQLAQEEKSKAENEIIKLRSELAESRHEREIEQAQAAKAAADARSDLVKGHQEKVQALESKVQDVESQLQRRIDELEREGVDERARHAQVAQQLQNAENAAKEAETQHQDDFAQSEAILATTFKKRLGELRREAAIEQGKLSAEIEELTRELAQLKQYDSGMRRFEAEAANMVEQGYVSRQGRTYGQPSTSRSASANNTERYTHVE